MSLSPAIIDAMVASGCTAEQLAAVVKASLAEQEHRIADKRAKDAERQRRHRASRNVTVTERDSRDECDITPPSAPPNDIYSNPPHHPPLQKSGARKGSRLPDDWFPKPLPSELAAAVARWPDGEVEKQMAMFRDWAASAPGSKGIKSDWDAAWRNWLRRVDGERPRQSSPPRQAPSNANTLKLLREKLHGTGY